MDRYEQVVKIAEGLRKANLEGSCEIRSEVELMSIRGILVEQTRYLASLQTETNKTLRQVATSLEVQNELLTRLLNKLDGVSSTTQPANVLSQSTSAHQRTTSENN